jgi:acyl carrier protein
MAKLTHGEIVDKFSQIVAKSLHIDAATVTEASFLDDLGAESLDLIEITMETEEAFNVWISEKSILDTAKEVFGPDILEKDGFLTQNGKALLLRCVDSNDRRTSQPCCPSLPALRRRTGQGRRVQDEVQTMWR